MHANAIDLTGKRFGRLTVVAEAGRNMDGSVIWLCQCDCGKMTKTIGTRMRNGYVHSCGCAHMKHGQASSRGKRTRLYRIWLNMKTRCNNPKNPSYKDYGGRGIKLCREWQDYSSFSNWAMNNGYSDFLTIDRINNDEGYEPSNCRWATCKEQRDNQRTNNHESGCASKNIDIIEAIKFSRLYHYQVAQICNINKSTLVRWLHNELTPQRREMILNAIKQGREEHERL